MRAGTPTRKKLQRRPCASETDAGGALCPYVIAERRRSGHASSPDEDRLATAAWRRACAREGNCVGKFLVIVDQTPECLKALRFAARRAYKTNRSVMLLFIIEPDEFQHWRVVAETMKAEAREAAEARLTALCDEVHALTGSRPEYAVREGGKRDAVLQFISETPEICLLVLGAGVGEGPGPLVASLGGQMSGGMTVPVTIVPGGMSFEEIDAVC